MSGSIGRRALAETIGTAFLVVAVIGSGIAASRLSPEGPWIGGGGLWLGEVVATFGLALVVFGVLRSGSVGVTPFAVGAYVSAAYSFTSSTSFANPAVTVSPGLSNTFAGIRPSSAPLFVVFQLVGAAMAAGAIGALYADARKIAPQGVVPHKENGVHETST